jgi:hypothetical protein
MQRQETLDLPYLTLLCDNLKNRMFLQNFFPDSILGICYVFPVIHIIPLFHSQTISLGTRIRLLGQKRMFTDKTSVFDLKVLFYSP